MDLSKYYAHGIAVATAIAAQVIAWVPSWGTHTTTEKAVIAGGGFLLAIAMMLWDAVKNRPAGVTAVTATTGEAQSLESTFRGLLGRVDFGAIVKAELSKAGVTASSTPAPTTTSAGA